MSTHPDEHRHQQMIVRSRWDHGLPADPGIAPVSSEALTRLADALLAGLQARAAQKETADAR